jgi:hypothetical protein
MPDALGDEQSVVRLSGRDDTARKPEPCAPAAAHHAGPADLGQPGRKKFSP